MQVRELMQTWRVKHPCRACMTMATFNPEDCNDPTVKLMEITVWSEATTLSLISCTMYDVNGAVMENKKDILWLRSLGAEAILQSMRCKLCLPTKLENDWREAQTVRGFIEMLWLPPANCSRTSYINTLYNRTSPPCPDTSPALIHRPSPRR